MEHQSSKQISSFASFPVFLAFLCMGFGDVVGPMVSLAKNTFSLSNFMAQLLPLMGFLMFGLLSIPLGLFQDRKGKKYLFGDRTDYCIYRAYDANLRRNVRTCH